MHFQKYSFIPPSMIMCYVNDLIILFLEDLALIMKVVRVMLPILP
jgi:hypothetical protein